MSDTSLVLRYPSNHIKLSKRDPSHQSNLQLSNSFSKISEKKTNVQIAQTQNFNIKENFNKISFSKALETNQPQTEDVQKLINLSENLNMENNNLKKKMENMKEKLSHPKLFKNTDQILDFKGFIKSVFIYKVKEFLSYIFRISKDLMNY